MEENIPKGLTKREYFAAMALQGICANRHHLLLQHSVTSAVALADLLIKKLDEVKEKNDNTNV